MSEEFVKAMMRWRAIWIPLATKMPFSGHECLVASLAEQRRDGDTAIGQKTPVSRFMIVRRHRPDASLMGIKTGQQ